MLKKLAVFTVGIVISLAVIGAWIFNSVAFEPTLFKYRHYYYKIFKHNNVNELLRRAYQTFHVPKAGLIHIGARYAEELPFYKHYNIKHVLWIEADPEAETKLLQITSKHPGSKVAMFAATDTNGFINLRKTDNDGHSSSIFKLKNHLTYYPCIAEVKILNVPQRRLDDYLQETGMALQQPYNIIVLDIQGAELVALKGATNTLSHIDAIITETNYDELYEGAVFIRELDNYLAQHDFIRVDSASSTHYTGDALYVKAKFFGLDSLNS